MPKSGKRADLAAWIESNRPESIDLALAAELRAHLAPISESYFRKLLREANVPLAPLVAGVRQDDFAALEASLLSLLDEYESGDRATQSLARKLVIEAKQHAEWSKKTEKPRAKGDGLLCPQPADTQQVEEFSVDRAVRPLLPDKTEMLLWLRTWLENPPLFPQWLRLRKNVVRVEPQAETPGT